MSSHRGRPACVEDYDETTGTVDRDNRQVASTKKSKRHRESRKPAYVEDYDETTGTVDRDNRQVTSTKKSKGHRESRKPRISFSDAQYPGQSSSRDAPAVEEEKAVRVEHRGYFSSDDILSGDEMFVSSSLPSQVPVSRESLSFPPSGTMKSPEMWDPDFLSFQRSSPILTEDPWALPPPHMITSITNSPLDYSPSLDGLSPRYVEDFANLVEPAPYTTTSDRVIRKPISPRQSKVTSDSRRTRVTSGESFNKLASRSSLELDNTAREHPLYYNVTPKADGLYHCPFEDDPKMNCTHKPEKLKCNYDKFVDSHLKPYKCKVNTCKELCFSSTACLLRHEREAHAMHGHGDKPFLCTYENCDRAVPGNGFPRHWNLRDHMKRVHQDPGHNPKSNASGSPPASGPPARNRKRKASDLTAEAPFMEKPQKRNTTPPAVIPQPQEPSLVERYQEKYEILLDTVAKLQDPKNTENIALLRNATEHIKVMVQTTQRIRSAPAIGQNFNQQSG